MPIPMMEKATKAINKNSRSCHSNPPKQSCNPVIAHYEGFTVINRKMRIGQPDQYIARNPFNKKLEIVAGSIPEMQKKINRYLSSQSQTRTYVKANHKLLGMDMAERTSCSLNKVRIIGKIMLADKKKPTREEIVNKLIVRFHGFSAEQIEGVL